MAALQAGKYDIAEEAYLEALAHDPGSVRAALGLQVMCERLGRTEEAQRYADLARRCWARARRASAGDRVIQPAHGAGQLNSSGGRRESDVGPLNRGFAPAHSGKVGPITAEKASQQTSTREAGQSFGTPLESPKSRTGPTKIGA